MISPSKKISGLARPEPPPQYSLAQESECFLTGLADKVNQLAAYTGADSSVSYEEYEADVARMQRFITFMLATDYQVSTSVKLTKQDRTHFYGMHKALGDLGKVWPSRRPSNPERHPLAPYFWQYLHVPCTALGICTEVLVATIYRFVKYSNSQGNYKGCILGLARNEGMAVLAQKLYIDRVMLFHVAVEGNKVLHAKFNDFANNITALYFERIDHPTEGRRGIQHLWSNTKCLSFDISKRGKLYELRKFNASLVAVYQLPLWWHEQQDWWNLRQQQGVSKQNGKVAPLLLKA